MRIFTSQGQLNVFYHLMAWLIIYFGLVTIPLKRVIITQKYRRNEALAVGE